jgi:hypothetical protein
MLSIGCLRVSTSAASSATLCERLPPVRAE